MSLEGAKLICLNDADGSEGRICLAHGRTFKFGYYMDSDIVLEHSDALGLHCTIDCDAFGRVTIENRCPEHPITLDGKMLKKMRPLLHNTEICILDKKYLWQFEGNPQAGVFQSEDASDFATPCKQMKKAKQPPMSEPARRWRMQYHKRLTIHNFAYSIMAGENSPAVEVPTDENKPFNTYERIISPVPFEQASMKQSSSALATDLIDLKTPNVKQKSFAARKPPLSCCKLSETVITSYSPRETGVRPEKSFAIVQSPAATPKKSSVPSDISLGPFQHTPSPLAHNYRPSMHLIDLTTPMKRVPLSSPSSNVLKSALKKGTLKAKAPHKTTSCIAETSPASMDSSVYSVHSTDDSVIELSDEGSFSPSPVLKTPQRPRTPQSLMKRAILSSAKKAAITKRLQQPPKPPPPTPLTPKNPPSASNVRFQSQSTPQRKSLGRFQSPDERLKASQSVSGKVTKSMVTSTPFRAGDSATTVSRRSSILRSPSTSLTGLKNKSRVSLMLTQALSKSPQTNASQRRKSVTFIEATKSPCKSVTKARKSVSFLDRIESEEFEEKQTLNETFSLEDSQIDEKKTDECVNTTTRKDATFSPEKDKTEVEGGSSESKEICSVLSSVPEQHFQVICSPAMTGLKPLNVTFSPEKDADSIVSQARSESTNQTTAKAQSNTEDPQSAGDELNRTTQSTSENPSTPQTPQSSRRHSSHTKSTPKSTTMQSASDDNQCDIVEDDDFEGLDAIFKTPKARNLMILSSPKSIGLQKPTKDSVELIHSTEYDLSASLDAIFKTPHSELTSNRVQTLATPAENAQPFTPEEAFDVLVGRPISRRSYTRKPSPKKQELSSLNVARDPTLPKTDIEEWIENVNESVELLDTDQDDEDELSYLTATTQGEFSRDPLMMSSIAGSVSTTNEKRRNKSPTDESVITIQEDDEEDTLENASALKDPLESTVQTPKRSLSPNISGIDLLDHTSESLFSETLAVSDESSGENETEKNVSKRDREETITDLNEDIQISPDKARREMERAFANFEAERRIVERKRLVSTPEQKKAIKKLPTRRTMGNQQTLHAFFDVKALKAEREMELAFEKFEKSPKRVVGARLAKTPELVKSKPMRRDIRKTMGNQVDLVGSFDLEAAKSEKEMELAFENFEEKPVFSGKRSVQTPEAKKMAQKDNRRTMGSNLESEVKLDLRATKSKREMELAFENFVEEPTTQKERLAQTPHPKKGTLKDHRRSAGSSLVSEAKLDLKAAKAEREMELAFENFEEEPEFSAERVVQTPEPKKVSSKDHRRTMGSGLVSKVTLDLQAAKAEREMELAFENFEEEPEFAAERVVQTPEPKKVSSKDHRRTMGSGLVSKVTLDLQAAKAEREMVLAFENFEEEPEFAAERVVQTPEPKKVSSKDHRRTMGSGLVSKVTLDLQAAKAEREMELAFENFEEEPEFAAERVVQTPEPKKVSSKDHRRTMGSGLVSKVTLDLQAAKAEREMELAFQNFEEEPEFAAERVVQTPEPKKVSSKDHRRTMGSGLVSKVTLDLQAAKAEREMELAFENFEEEPEFAAERVVQTPETKKVSSKDHRRTMGSGLVSEVTLDLQAAKAEREMELAFENFEEEPEFDAERVVQTPEPKKVSSKDHRRTMGSGLVSEVTLDLEAAKAEREMELAFENFEEEPKFAAERVVQTPEPKKVSSKDHRRTMGSGLVSEVTLDLQAAKAEREMELAFENFEEEPKFADERVVQTPEPKKVSANDHRRTMGSGLVSKVTLDLEAAKAEREMELAFQNFEEEPEFSVKRVVRTPEPKKVSSKDHRRTMGSGLVSKVTLDLQAAKAERAMELAFENFEEEPEFAAERVVQTPEPKKVTSKDHRRTMGSGLVSKVTLDLQAAKAEREMELAFENFEEEPEFAAERVVQTPQPKKVSSKDHRRTIGSGLVSKVTLDLQAAKAEREMELAFENFEEEPEFAAERVVQTPEPKKVSSKDHRRTMGSGLVSKVTLDLQAAKAEREMELAFENFAEEPEFAAERVVQTPEPKKVSSKDHRRTMGSGLVSKVTLDLQAAKAEREMELAFENFEEEPEFSAKRVVQTPEFKKAPSKDHRRTIGSNLMSDVYLDLKAAKAQLELTREQEVALVEDDTVFQKETENDNLMPESEEAVESQISSANEELQVEDEKMVKVSQEVTHEEHQEGVLSKDSSNKQAPKKADEQSTPSTTLLRARRRRRNTTDEDEKAENIVTSSVKDQTEEIATSTPTISQPRSRRKRQNTIDALEAQQEGSSTTELMTTQATQTRKRTRRQNSVDVSSKPIETPQHHQNETNLDHATDEKTSGDTDPTPNDKETVEVEKEPSPITSRGTRKRRKNSTSEDKPVENHIIPIDSTGVESTDDEIKHTPSTRAKRVRKVGSITTPTSQIVEEIHHDLEPIIEEEKITGTPAINQEAAPDDSAIVSEEISEDPVSKAVHHEDAAKTQTKQNVGASLKPRNRRNKSTSEDEAHTTGVDTILSQAEGEDLYCVELVTEEDKKLEIPSKNQEAIEAASAKQASKPVRRRAGRNQAPEQEEKLINIKPELDEVITSSPIPSNTRIRGRRAHLNVVLIESTNTGASSSLNVMQVAGTEKEDTDGEKSRTWQTLSVKLEPVEEIPSETSNTSMLENNDQEIVQKINEIKVQETEVDDVIPSTPAPVKPRGRRLASKAQSAESTAVPALRRGRRGSIQQDHEESVPSTPVLSKSRSRTAVVKVEPTEPTSVKSTPVRRRGRKDDVAEENVEDAIPSTPVPSKTRGRRALQKPETVDSVATPPPKRGRRGAAMPSTAEDVTKLDADVPLANLPETSTPDVVQSTPAPLKTRRRRAPLNIEPTRSSAEEVTEVSDVEEMIERIQVVTENATAAERVKQDIDVQSEEVVLPKKRGRKAVLKVEPVAVITETNVEDNGQPNEEPTKTRRGKARVNERDEASPAPEAQVLIKTRGRRAAIKAEPELSTPQSSTPARRGRRRGAIEDEQEVKEAAESAERIQVVEENAIVEASTEAEHDIVVYAQQTKVDEIAPPIPLPLKKRGRKAAPKVEPVEGTAESSTPARKRARRGTVDTELHAEEVEAAASKTRDLAAALILESAVSSSETSTPARKRGLRGAVKEDPEVHTEEDDMEKIIPSKKRGRLAIQTPLEQDSETHTEEDDVEKVIPSKRRGRAVPFQPETTESTAGNSTKRGQGRAVEHTGELDSGADEAVPSKKRGHPQRLKLEPTDSASESSTPARKRGRRGAAPEDTHNANTTDGTTAVPDEVATEVSDAEVVPLPSRSRRGPGSQKVASASENKKRGKKATTNLSVNQADDEKSEGETTDSTPVNPEVEQKSGSTRNPTRSRRSSVKETKVQQVVSAEDQVQTTEVSTSEVKAQKKPVRSRRVLSSASPSYATSEAEQTYSAESEEKSEKKPIRGRRAAPKKDTNAESTSHTEEEQPASETKKKPTRSRKVVVKVDTSTEKEQSQAEEPKTTRGRKPTTKADAAEVEVITEENPTVTEPPTKKPARGRKAAQPKSKPAVEPVEVQPLSPAPTKATRTRKAPTSQVAKDTDDEQSQSEAPKKPTRSRKASESAKDDEKAVSKRANLRNLEVSTDNDTPSKRIRRKPKMLLTDEFVH